MDFLPVPGMNSSTGSNRIERVVPDSIIYLYVILFLRVKFVKVYFIYTYINNITMYNNYATFNNQNDYRRFDWLNLLIL